MSLRVATISGILLILLCGYSSALRAQSNLKGPTVPLKFDEFGAVGHCDMGARLDNFAIMLAETPGATAHIIAYGPDGNGKGVTNQQLSILTAYLIDARGINPEHVKAVYGGRNSELTQPRVQLWIIPQNTIPPEPEKFENNSATFKGMFLETNTYDDFGVWYEYSEGMGPGVGRMIDASFAEVLQEQKNSVAYIVAYNNDESLPGAWRRAAERSVERLKDFNIDPSRVKIIFGGQTDKSKVQLWILPKDAPPPVVEVKRESSPKEVIKAGDLTADYLAYKEHEALSFKTLADVLRTDKTTRAFIAVHLELPPPPPAEAQKAEAEPVEDEVADSDLPETPDVTKLVEKWRTELTTTHKIRNDRIIVIFLPGTEFNSNSISVWFVPKGQPLPDPTKEEEEEVEDPEPPPAKPN